MKFATLLKSINYRKLAISMLPVITTLVLALTLNASAECIGTSDPENPWCP